MKHAETVTFGGSNLDRAAHLRTDPAALEAAMENPKARAVLMWRGKPLVSGADRGALVRLPMDHAIIGGEVGNRDSVIFLGLDDAGAPLFACDCSTWEPDSYDAEALGLFLDPSEQSHPALPDDHVFAELRRIMTGLDARDAELAATAKAIISWHDTHRFCARCGTRSDITQGGWQRTCPACRSHHFPRTDPVVIMLITHGNSVLMGRSPGWPAGMFSLLAGFVEPGETLEAAVRREVFEEAGVRVGQVDYLASQPWPFPASLMFGCHGRAVSAAITIDPVEIEAAMWVDREEMMDAFEGRHPVLKPARKGAIAHFLLENWLADTLD
jgi:NAD+ diphosphatase